MCPVGIWMSVSRLRWLRIAAENQGVSSQTGSTITTKKDVVVCVCGRCEDVKNRFSHVSRVVLRVCGARSCQSVAEGVVECSKGGVLWVCGAKDDAWLHGAIEGAGEEFRPRVECEFDGPLYT